MQSRWRDQSILLSSPAVFADLSGLRLVGHLVWSLPGYAVSRLRRGLFYRIEEHLFMEKIYPTLSLHWPALQLHISLAYR